jgi:hypothetical protein
MQHLQFVAVCCPLWTEMSGPVCTDGGIARKAAWYADRRPASSLPWSKKTPICSCDVQTAGTVHRCTDGCAVIWSAQSCERAFTAVAWVSNWLQLQSDWVLAVRTVPIDTRRQYCANWHSLWVLCHVTLAVSTVPLDNHCHYCDTWHSLSVLCHLTLAVSTASCHPLWVLCHLTLAVSTVPLDTRQYCANWHSLSELCHLTHLTLAVSTVPGAIEKLTSSEHTRPSHWHHTVCVFYIALIYFCTVAIGTVTPCRYSNTLYNECCLYNSHTGNVAAAEFRFCFACWQVWSWSSKWTFPATNIVSWQ